MRYTSKTKPMKNLLKLTSALVLFSILFAACKKYPEGPALTVRTATHRVVNTWKAENVTMNSTDVTSAYANANYTETYDKDGNYSYNTSLGGGSGKWAFQNNKKEIKRNGVSGQSSVDMTILKLKEKEFWFKFTDNGDNYEFHMIPN